MFVEGGGSVVAQKVIDQESKEKALQVAREEWNGEGKIGSGKEILVMGED